MRSFWILAAVAAVLLLGLFYFFAEKIPLGTEAERPAVAATIYPIFDITRNVTGEQTEVKLILPPGASPHLFEFSPRQLQELQSVRAVFAIGHGLDDWAIQVTRVAKEARVITVDQGIQLRTFESGAVDPHYWLHFGNARIITANIARGLAEIDPEHAAVYRANAEEYEQKLERTEKQLQQLLAPARASSILTFHDAWFYFARDFGLNIVGTFEPAAGVEPTPRYLARLRQEILGNHIRIIFIEPQLSTAVLEGFAKDNNLGVAELDPLGGVEDRRTYLELMQFNANAVEQALAEENR